MLNKPIMWELDVFPTGIVISDLCLWGVGARLRVGRRAWNWDITPPALPDWVWRSALASG